MPKEIPDSHRNYSLNQNILLFALQMYWLRLCWNKAFLTVSVMVSWLRREGQQHGHFKCVHNIRPIIRRATLRRQCLMLPRTSKSTYYAPDSYFWTGQTKARVQKYWKILLATEPETWHMKHEVLKSTERKISASVNGVVWRGEGKMDGGKGAITPSFSAASPPTREFLTANEARRYMTSMLAPSSTSWKFNLHLTGV